MAEYIGQCIDLDTIYSDITAEDCELIKTLLSDNFSGFRSFVMVRMIYCYRYMISRIMMIFVIICVFIFTFNNTLLISLCIYLYLLLSLQIEPTIYKISR